MWLGHAVHIARAWRDFLEQDMSILGSMPLPCVTPSPMAPRLLLDRINAAKCGPSRSYLQIIE